MTVTENTLQRPEKNVWKGHHNYIDLQAARPLQVSSIFLLTYAESTFFEGWSVLNIMLALFRISQANSLDRVEQTGSSQREASDWLIYESATQRFWNMKKLILKQYLLMIQFSFFFVCVSCRLSWRWRYNCNQNYYKARKLIQSVVYDESKNWEYWKSIFI